MQLEHKVRIDGAWGFAEYEIMADRAQEAVDKAITRFKEKHGYQAMVVSYQGTT